MIKTGYISFISKPTGTKDDDGNPIKAIGTPSDYIACNLKQVRSGYKIYADGQTKDASYSIYVKRSTFDSLGIDLESIHFVTVRGNESNELGEFQILSHEYLNLTKRIKLIV